MDVRPWDKPQLLNQKPIPNDSSHATSFPVGLNWCDIDRGGNISIKAHVIGNSGKTTTHLDASGDTILYSAGSTWLNVCKNDRDFQFGTFSTVGHEKSSPSWSIPVTFDKSFGSVPKVVVWFQEFEFDKAHNWRLQASAENITATGFTLKLSTWGDSKLYKAGVTWIAHPSNRSNITSGTFDTREFRPWSAPKLDNKKSITFDKKFDTAPRCYVGLNLFDIDFHQNFRLKALAKDITPQGMTLHLDSWYDTTHYASRADYIAIQDY
ncbi:hypothetical protein FRC09_004260 [Ceratobasidium sp. 395]|nr:hypothetical protein FRC09_004260 [Ceratobasidium sp. 395]